MFLDWNTNSWASYPTTNMSGVPLLECPRSRRPSAPAHLRWRDCIQTAPYTVVSLVLWRVKKNTKWKEQVPCAPCAAYKGYAELQWAVSVTSQLHCGITVKKKKKASGQSRKWKGNSYWSGDLMADRWHTQLNKQKFGVWVWACFLEEVEESGAVYT